MEASNRKIEDWFHKIKNGEIKLPRFQRFESWDWDRICSLANTITHNLPLGITLVLEVGEKEPFISRYLSTAPETGNNVIEHLLDGQQRLTAFWRVLHNNYEYEKYFVFIPEFDNYGEKESEEQFIFCRGRYYRDNGTKYPLWCDNPAESLRRGMIPTDLLKPLDMQIEIDKWIKDATAPLYPEDHEKLEDFYLLRNKISSKIQELRSIVSNYNLPYLSLPSNTSKDVALEVFINMNTNSKPLSTYDIIVAEVESELGQSLHDKQEELINRFPSIEIYDDVSRLVLNTSALLQDKFPNQKGAWEMDKSKMVENWDVMSVGLYKMSKLLSSEGIFDKHRLPTKAILWVLAALYKFVPDSGDKKGWAENILCKYIWRASFTDRYENSAATHAYYDYLALKKVLTKQVNAEGVLYTEESIPIFNNTDYEIANAHEIINIAWPKNASIRARAILAVTTKLGARDFATNEKVMQDNIISRHYHHIFPDSIIVETGLKNSYIAMNCALINDKTNLNIGKKEPLTYLKERFKWTDQETMQNRLNSHLIPIQELKNGGYDGISDTQRIEKTKNDYEAFIAKRALFFELAVNKLCNGEYLNAKEIVDKVNQ